VLIWWEKQKLEVKVDDPCDLYEKALGLGKVQHEGTE
jgi:hypothetical protein